MDSSASDTPKPSAPSEPGERPIHATLIDWPPNDERPTIAVPVSQGYDRERVYGVTRRFSLATVMMMMAGTSLMLAFLNALGTPPTVSGILVLLCMATALGQMFLFGGRQPRAASLVVGAVFWFLVPLGGHVIVQVVRIPPVRMHDGWTEFLIGRNWPETMFVGALLGAIPGYLAGGLVAGVLLVMDLTESIFARWRKVREPDDAPWPPPKNSPKSGAVATPLDEARANIGD